MNKTKDDYLEMIDEVMTQIDWIKIHSVMKHLNWVWFEYEKQGEVPIYALIKEGRRLLEETLNEYLQTKNEITIGTGGFYATCSEGLITLKFILEQGIGCVEENE